MRCCHSPCQPTRNRSTCTSLTEVRMWSPCSGARIWSSSGSSVDWAWLRASWDCRTALPWIRRAISTWPKPQARKLPIPPERGRSAWDNASRNFYSRERGLFDSWSGHFPKDPQPAWFGYSVGIWEGDTFVVTTVGFNDQSWLRQRTSPYRGIAYDR